MAIAFDNADSVGSPGFAALLTLSGFAVGAGADRLLLLGTGVEQSGGANMSTVVFNGSEGATKIASVVQNGVEGAVWKLLAPSNATGDIVATPTSGARMSMGVISLAGVNQGTPLGTEQLFQDASNQNATVDVTTAVTNAWIASFCACKGRDFSSVPGSGQTERYDVSSAGSPPSGRINCSGNTRQNLAINTYSMDHTLSGVSGFDGVVLYAIEVKPNGAVAENHTQIMSVN